ncbi:MAG: ATP-binding protein [bacterium]
MNDNKNSEAGKISKPRSNNESKADIDPRILVYQKQLRRLASELSLAEARERREIASDLHDHIGQALAFVSQKIGMLQGNAIFSGMEDDFTEILSILNQTIHYTRNLTVEISPPVLYELGLPAAIDWLSERALKRYELKVISSQSGRPIDIPDNVKVFMFKAIQELIHNAAKHAKAKIVRISSKWRESDFEVIVSDDGQGFDTTIFEGGLSDNCCFGLFSIRERLSYIGGNLSIESASGKGTKVTIVAPYETVEEDIQ